MDAIFEERCLIEFVGVRNIIVGLQRMPLSREMRMFHFDIGEKSIRGAKRLFNPCSLFLKFEKAIIFILDE